MVIMDIRIDNFYQFKNFHMNMSYPKKIVDSTIEAEYLAGLPNFRYKKVNIIMGANASGKTSLGRLLMKFTNDFSDQNYTRFLSAINNKKKKASFQIDFVSQENILYRYILRIIPGQNLLKDTPAAQTRLLHTEIGRRDNYETCARRLDQLCEEGAETSDNASTVDIDGWLFSYPTDSGENKSYYTIEDRPEYIGILERILKVLDPSIQAVLKLKEVENSYAIKMENQAIIIQDGKINDSTVLSSGTKAGLDISYIIASMICDLHDFYYCDELFSFVSSDVEKACLSIMIGKLKDRKQLFFTTHNTDILDMQLPKHSFTFLKKLVNEKNSSIQCVYASDFLKRNTDSLKNAVENDLFSIAPDLEKIYEIEEL